MTQLNRLTAACAICPLRESCQIYAVGGPSTPEDFQESARLLIGAYAGAMVRLAGVSIDTASSALGELPERAQESVAEHYQLAAATAMVVVAAGMRPEPTE